MGEAAKWEVRGGSAGGKVDGRAGRCGRGDTRVARNVYSPSRNGNGIVRKHQPGVCIQGQDLGPCTLLPSLSDLVLQTRSSPPTPPVHSMVRHEDMYYSLQQVVTCRWKRMSQEGVVGWMGCNKYQSFQAPEWVMGSLGIESEAR